MKIFLGITTYDRPEYLKKTITSLYASNGIEKCHIYVFDDCSPYWSLSELKTMFPDNVKVSRNKFNQGSDENIREMYKFFLNSNDDVLISIDSDLIFHPEWLEFIEDNIDITDGIFSLYNSICHPMISKKYNKKSPFIEKEHIGSAGVVMTREIVKKIIDNVPKSSYYDWDWSKYLFNNKIRLLVTRRSYIQHLGVLGYNNNGVLADIGLGFIPGSKKNEMWNMETFENIIKLQRDKLAKLLS